MKDSRELAAKIEFHRQGLMIFKSRYMPDWARDIVTEVCDRRGVHAVDMAGPSRRLPVVAARNEAIYLIKARKPILSSSRLGQWFDRDHTSCLYALASHAQASGLPALGRFDVQTARQRNKQASRDRGHLPWWKYAASRRGEDVEQVA